MSKKEMFRWGAKMCMSLFIGAACARLDMFGVFLLVLWIVYLACEAFLAEKIVITVEPTIFIEKPKKEEPKESEENE